MATSPLPSRGSPPLQSGGGGGSEGAHLWAKWLRHPCRLGDPHAAERGGKSEVAHKWAKWLRHPCRLGDPHRFKAGERGAQSEVAHKWAKWLCHPCRLGDPHRCRAGGKIRSGPLVGKMAMSALPSHRSPPLQSGGKNRKWPPSGQNGYVTLAVSGITTAAERGGGGGSRKWPTCRRNGYVTPCRLGDPHRCRAGGKFRSGPLVGKMATSPLPSRGSPPLQSGGGNQKWPTCGQNGYVTPCRLGDPRRCRAGGRIRSGPLVGKMAMSPLPSRGSPPLQSGGQNQRWPTCGQNGYVSPAVSGIPTAAERGAKSEVAHLWAKWLCHPCRLGDPHRCKAGGRIRSGPLVGKMAMSPLPSRGSPPLQSGGQNQKWPTSGQSGYVTPCRLGDPHRCRAGGGNQKWPTCWRNGYVTSAVSGIPGAAERGGGGSEVAHLWAKWLRHLCRLGDPHRCRAGGGGFRSGPLVGKMATSPLPSRGPPPLQSGGQNQKWPTSGQSGYGTPCRLGDPHRFKGAGKIRSGPLVGKVAMSPLPSWGSPPLQSGGQNQKWPTSGENGYVSPAV